MAVQCANTTGACQKLATVTCKGCRLVAYCGGACQYKHLQIHKKHCENAMNKNDWKPVWHVEGRLFDFVTVVPTSLTYCDTAKYLWDNVPAIDILKLDQHEGTCEGQELNLMFGASGDLRNVITTIANLPESFDGKCQVVVNDCDADIVARNIILLMSALKYEPSVATFMIIHLWYSALITEEMSGKLKDDFLPLIIEVLSRIKDKSPASLLSKTWTFGNRKLNVVITKEQWGKLPNYLVGCNGITKDEALKNRSDLTMAASRKDFRDGVLYLKPPAQRLATTKFWKEGMLLPFGASRDTFNTPNPMMFSAEGCWLIPDTADPLDSFMIAEILVKTSIASNDIYGALNVYLTDLFFRFCQRIQNLDITFILFQVDAKVLPATLGSCGKIKDGFDRIELSNIADTRWVGIACCLDKFGPLLRAQNKNKHASIITAFMNAVRHTADITDYMLPMEQNFPRLAKYLELLKPGWAGKPIWDADMLRATAAGQMLMDYDSIFAKYMIKQDFTNAARSANLIMKGTNTIVKEWPTQLPENATQKEFDLLLASNDPGWIRYCEWKREN